MIKNSNFIELFYSCLIFLFINKYTIKYIFVQNIIIFGGAGFIGTNLIKYLLDKDNKILCVDNLYTGQKSNIEYFSLNPKYMFFNFDITNNSYSSLKDIIGKYLNNHIDEIYNLACPASPPKYQKDPIYTIHCSLAVENICKLAIDYNAKFLHASTSEVYGDPLIHPQPENYKGNVNTVGPRSCYDKVNALQKQLYMNILNLD